MKIILFVYLIGVLVNIGIAEILVDKQSDEIVSEISTQVRCTEYREFPWRSSDVVYPPGMPGLHKEIEQFSEYIQPTEIERAFRQRVIDRIESVVKRIWPNAYLKLYGSNSVGFALANSDIDLMIIGATGELPLRRLATELSNNNISEPNTLCIRDNVTVPIIEFIDRQSQINIDMPMYHGSTFNFAKMFKGYQSKYPVLLKLVLVLKQYLRERNLNDVFTGGMSSYGLTIMCISYLQMHPTYKPHENATVNLGELLLGFFELYGYKFDFESSGISIDNDGKYYARKDLPCPMINIERELFCIEDPKNHSINVGDEIYRGYDVKQAFENGFVLLSDAIATNQNNSNDCKPSILGSIVHFTDDFIKYRKWISESF